MFETGALLLGLAALATFLILALADRFAAEDEEHPRYDSVGDVR